MYTNINTPTVFSGTLRASYDPSKKKKKINESCYTNGEELTSEKEQEGKMELDQGTGGERWEEYRVKRAWAFQLIFVSSLYGICCCFFLWEQYPESLDWIFTAGCVWHFNESDSLQLVYGDLIGCCCSLQTPPECLIGYLSRKYAI